jgi:hypothetical protein
MAQSSPEGIVLGKGSTLVKMELSVSEKQQTDILEMGQIAAKEEPKTNLERLPFPELVEEFAEYYKKVPLVEEPKQVNTKQIMYNIGDVIEIINPTKNQPKLFKTHKVDIDFGVVYYYELNGKEETIGFSYIKKVEHKEETLEEVAKNYANIPLHRDIDTEERYFNSNVRDYDSFIEGAKWQQEQDKNKFSELVDLLERLTPIYREDTDLHQKWELKRLEIIEQFKKK